jgi:molybdopterin-containing oxidoreductase family iron-sulfur binding subunit
MKAGTVHTLLMSGVNPVYAYLIPFVEGLKKGSLPVAMSLKEDETVYCLLLLLQFLII